MACDSCDSAAQTRRVSRRELRPPLPPATDLDGSLQPDMSRVPRASQRQGLHAGEVPHEPSGLLPSGVVAAHVKRVLTEASGHHLSHQRRPLPQSTARRILDDHADPSPASSTKKPNEGTPTRVVLIWHLRTRLGRGPRGARWGQPKQPHTPRPYPSLETPNNLWAPHIMMSSVSSIDWRQDSKSSGSAAIGDGTAAREDLQDSRRAASSASTAVQTRGRDTGDSFPRRRCRQHGLR
jgi:hypothetical protein